MKKDKLIRATIHKIINDDNCKSTMNLNIKGLPEFENLPEWFLLHCQYTSNLIKEIRDVILRDENIMTDIQYNEYLKRSIKDSNINNLLY